MAGEEAVSAEHIQLEPQAQGPQLPLALLGHVLGLAGTWGGNTAAWNVCRCVCRVWGAGGVYVCVGGGRWGGRACEHICSMCA